MLNKINYIFYGLLLLINSCVQFAATGDSYEGILNSSKITFSFDPESFSWMETFENDITNHVQLRGKRLSGRYPRTVNTPEPILTSEPYFEWINKMETINNKSDYADLVISTSKLCEVTLDQLESMEISFTISYLKNATYKLEELISEKDELKDFEDMRVTNIVTNIVNASSNLLNINWGNFSNWNEKITTANMLTKNVEKAAQIFAKNTVQDKIWHRLKFKKIELSLRELQEPYIEDSKSQSYIFDSKCSENITFASYSEIAEIVTYVEYKDFGEIFGFPPYERTNSRLSSTVMSVFLNDYNSSIVESCISTFKVDQRSNVKNIVCVFWNTKRYRWLQDGCTLTNRNDSHVTCSCNHLGYFGLLMNNEVTETSTSVEETHFPYSSSLRPSVTDLVNSTNEFCPERKEHNIVWPKTYSYSKTVTVLRKCPNNPHYAKWNCNGTQWTPDHPDTIYCTSKMATYVPPISMAPNLSYVELATTKLNQSTKGISVFEDIQFITNYIKETNDKVEELINSNNTFIDANDEVKNIIHNVMDAVSNLLAVNLAWNNSSNWNEKMSASNNLLKSMEKGAFILGATALDENEKRVTNQNIDMSVQIIKNSRNASILYHSENRKTSVVVPNLAVANYSDDLIIFIEYQNMRDILDSLKYTTNLILNSNVMSVSVGQKLIDYPLILEAPIKINFTMIQNINGSAPSCVSWNFTISSWSQEGCELDERMDYYVVCSCKHLTNFALLMNFGEITVDPINERMLEIITNIGCGISIVCLILAVLTFSTFKNIQSIATKIHFHLCLCLLLAECVFIIGIDQTELKIACGVIAASLHYLFLCVFCWMFIEGVQIVLMLVQVFKSKASSLKCYCMFGYGLPFIILVTSVASYPQGYGTKNYCWLSTEYHFNFTFLVPAVFILLCNAIFLGIAIFMIYKYLHNNIDITQKHSKNTSTIVHISSWLRRATILVFLLGITWMFGLFYINEKTLPFAYIFCILNSLQGFVIFMFHCVYDETVKVEYIRLWRKLTSSSITSYNVKNTSSNSESISTGITKKLDFKKLKLKT